jgi:hypothetical protein
MDAALSILRDADHPVFSTHGPMAIEALEDLGFASLAPGWAREYRKGLEPLPPALPLPDARLASALGDPSARGAWVARIDRELEAARWRDVVRHWLPRLLPAVSCDAAHGVIRLAHAVRSLTRQESPERLHELAEAIGYWAAVYEELPGVPGRGHPGLASEAITCVPVLPAEQQSWEGLITARLRALRVLSGFEASVSSLAPPTGVGGGKAFADDLARTAARLYLANAPRLRVIDFIHGLDAVTALRELIPFAGDHAGDALFYGWQTLAALHASVGGPLAPEAVEAPPASEIASQVERAVAVGGAHAIKFAQACVSEHARQGDPLFLACLSDMVARMEQWKAELGVVV